MKGGMVTMGDTYTLTQDNGSCNPGKRRRVVILKASLPGELRRYFGWRKELNYDRLMKQGSYEYDRFIKYLYEKGYGK